MPLFYSTISLALLKLGNKDIIKILKEYDEYFSQYTILSIFRELGWNIIKGLVTITTWITSLVEKVLSFTDYMNSDSYSQFVSLLKPIIWVIFLFGLMYLAYCYIIAHEKPKGIVTNIFMLMFTMLIMPYLVTQLNVYTHYAEELFTVSNEKGYALVTPYVTDLVYLDSIEFKKDKIKNGKMNGITNSSNLQFLDVNEVIDFNEDYQKESGNDKDKIKLKCYDVFTKELAIKSNTENGKDDVSLDDIKLNKFILKDSNPYYYRYHVNFIMAILFLLAVIVSLVMSSFKLLLLIYEIITANILAPFVAAGDITNGTKIKKLLQEILNLYITVILILFIQKLFVMFTTYIQITEWSKSMPVNSFVKTLMMLGAAYFVIDGPNFFEKIFGVDAGLKSVGQALQSTYYAGNMVKGAAKGASGAAKKLGKGMGDAAKGAVKTGAGALGALSGMRESSGNIASQNEMAQSEMNTRNNQQQSMIGNSNNDIQESMNNTDSNINNNMVDNTSSVTENANVNSNDMNSSNSSATQNLDTTSQSNSNDSANINTTDPGSSPLAGTGSSVHGQGQNLSNSFANDINSQINAGLNNPNNINSNSNMNGVGQQSNSLLDFAKENTKIGRSLSSSYNTGKKLGNALGNTFNNRNVDTSNHTNAAQNNSSSQQSTATQPKTPEKKNLDRTNLEK